MARRAKAKPLSGLGRVEQFLGFAAEVRELPIARRLDLNMLGQRYQFALRNDGEVINFGMRDEVAIESLGYAASVIRPALLPDDELYVPKVLGEARAHVGEGDALADLDSLCKAWTGFDKTLYWSASAWRGTDEEAPPMQSDRAIAWDYINGRFLHRDHERAQRIALLGNDTLQAALVLWVKDAIILCETTRQVLTNIRDAGLIETARRY